jgi:RNA polymerase sigma-70 factor (ECF subfamily)
LLKQFYLQEPVSQEEFVNRVHEHRAMLHKVCNLYCFSAHDRQDLFQEIIVQLWKSWPKFRGEAKFGTWLYRIALNTAITGLRKQKKQFRSIDPGGLPAETPDIPYPEEKEEQLQQLYVAIGQLTEVEKALVMLYLEDKSYDEMEEILGMNQNNLRVKMNRIKEKLRKITREGSYGIG